MLDCRDMLRSILDDIRHGRHLEAYAVFAIGLLLTPIGLLSDRGDQLLPSALLLAVTFLVFRTAIRPLDPSPGLDRVLRTRDRLGSFAEVAGEAAELWVYGPTAVNVIVHAADLRRHVLGRGGRLRVIVQDPGSPFLSAVRAQLDDSLDFDRTLDNSLATLRRLSDAGDCQVRLLAFNPGFSMVVVNPTRSDGYLILELHGFGDENISDRMHLRIGRAESLHWFDYWAARYRAMWEEAATFEVSPPGRRDDDAGSRPG
jgi:hypothetical protein